MKRNGWTKPQKKLASMACRNVFERIGLDVDDYRKLLLRQLGSCALLDGEPSFRSPDLRDQDFDKFMFYVEGSAPDGRVLNYPPGHWTAKFADDSTYGKLMYRALEMSHDLQDAGVYPGGAIARAIGREYETMQHLDERELHKAINAMRALAKRRGAV